MVSFNHSNWLPEMHLRDVPAMLLLMQETLDVIALLLYTKQTLCKLIQYLWSQINIIPKYNFFLGNYRMVFFWKLVTMWRRIFPISNLMMCCWIEHVFMYVQKNLYNFLFLFFFKKKWINFVDCPRSFSIFKHSYGYA